MSGRGDLLKIQRWVLKLSRPVYLTILAFALLAWMSAFAFVLGFPFRVGSPLLWVLDAGVIAAAWTSHVYLAMALPRLSQTNGAPRSVSRGEQEADHGADISPVALAIYPLVICALLALLLVTFWPSSFSHLGSYPVLAVPAALLAAWVVRYTRPTR